MDKIDNSDCINIKDLEFDTSEKSKKAIDTEDSVLTRLTEFANSKGFGILRRVSPPFESKVSKCDAILFSDAGIFLIEVMRHGGAIKFLNEKRDSIYIEHSGYNKQVNNPIIIINRKIKLLTRYIQDSNYWKKINQFYKDEKVSDSIPVYAVLCFGPSTSIKKSTYNEDSILVCTSRNIVPNLIKFIEAKQVVYGISKRAKQVAIRWRSQGKLTMVGKAGFLRCHPMEARGKTTNLLGLTKISGRKDNKLELTYEDDVPIKTKEIESIIFRYYKRHQTGNVIVDADSTFTWTTGY